MRFVPFFSLVLLVFSLGCSGDRRPPPADGGGDGGSDADAGTPPPPERCASFSAPGAGPRFTDVTAAWGVDAAGLDVLANRVSSGDLNGDGYPDVIVHRGGTHNPTDFTAEPRDYHYRVLMNVNGDHFEDRTRESNYGATRSDPPDVGRAAHFAVYADFDDDGDVDILSGTNGDPNDPGTDPGHRTELLLNDGTGVFSLGPMSAPLAGSASGVRIVPTTSATLLDHDRDGLLDVYIGNWYAQYGRSLYGIQDELAHNVGGGAFEYQTEAAGLLTDGDVDQPDTAAPTYGVTACDVDQDGDTDLLVSAYGRRWNQLWLHEGDTYREVGAESGFAGDDDLDYSDNEFYRCYCQTTGSCSAPSPRVACDGVLWNAGVDDQPFRLNGNTFTTACADVDSDGDMELYSAEIHHWHIGESSDSAELLVNDGPNASGVPTFSRPGNATDGLEVPRVGASWNEGGIVSALADLDNDGHMDVLLGTSDYPDQALWIYRQLADGTFEDVTDASGVDHPCAPGLSLTDLDRDGDLDLLVSSSTARDCSAIWTDGPPLRVYENVSGQDANWTQLHLEGAGAAAGGANRSAVGALVKVTAGGVTRTREVQAGQGHFGLQHDLDVTIGLGDACTIDRVEIIWPDTSGSVDTFDDVMANYRLVVRQGAGLEYVTD